MRIIVIDGQGGGIGRSLMEKLRAELPEAELVAVGTNSAATANMMRRAPTWERRGKTPSSSTARAPM